MRPSVLKDALAGLGAVLVWASCCFAAAAWKVSDLSGDVSRGRGSDHTAASVGLELAAGDVLDIGDGAWIELVSTGTCEVWELRGIGQFNFAEHEITSGPERKKVPPVQRLSVCFDPAGFSLGKAQRIGGILERGASPEDELSEIGAKSNAALINLIILYALHNKDIEKARPYYEALRERAPGSEFVAGVAEIFKENKAQ
jgi:hypothetical protein